MPQDDIELPVLRKSQQYLGINDAPAQAMLDRSNGFLEVGGFGLMPCPIPGTAKEQTSGPVLYQNAHTLVSISEGLWVKVNLFRAYSHCARGLFTRTSLLVSYHRAFAKKAIAHISITPHLCLTTRVLHQ